MDMFGAIRDVLTEFGPGFDEANWRRRAGSCAADTSAVRYRNSRAQGLGFCSRPYSPFNPNQKPVSAKPIPRRATKFFTGL